MYLSFLKIMRYSPTLGDVKILWVETGQAMSAFMFYWQELIVPALISLLFLAVFIWPAKKTSPLAKFPIRTAINIFPILPFLMITGMVTIKGGGAGVGIPAGVYGVNSYIASILYELATKPTIERNKVTINVGNKNIISNIILVVDESISGDFLNTDPNKTIVPVLGENNDIIADFGQTTAGHNCSSYSNSIIRWGITSNTLKDIETKPTIWQYAKKSGYTTTYIDAQKQPGTYGNHMSIQETADIDNMIQFKSPQIERDINYISNDFSAAKKSMELIRQNKFNFIFINKLGAHVPYEGKYPEKAGKYKPHMKLFESIDESKRDELINSYKNAISWNLENFFSELLVKGKLHNTLIIYTSDHGQNLLDDGKTTHCSRKSDSPYQGVVPLLLITENPELLERIKQGRNSNKDSASHFNIFPTLLILMGYDQKIVKLGYDQDLFSPVSRLGKMARGELLSFDVDKRSFKWLDIPENIEPRL